MKKTLICAGLGAAAMYFLDPELGAVRRSIFMDKFGGALPKTKDALESKAEAVVAKASEVTEKVDSAAADKIEHLAADTVKPTEETA
jgi:hypothetical protein